MYKNESKEKNVRITAFSSYVDNAASGQRKAAETETSTSYCTVTEGCTLTANHDGECVLKSEESVILQTQTESDQTDSNQTNSDQTNVQATNDSWNDIIDQIRTIPRNDTWSGSGDIVIDIECPDYVVVEEAMLAWGNDPIIVNEIMISNTNKTVTLAESGLKEFFKNHLEGGIAQIQFSLKNLNDPSAGNRQVYCEVEILPLAVDDSWPYEVGYFKDMQAAEGAILSAVSTQSATTLKAYLTNGVSAENVLSETVLNRLKENQKTLVISYRGMYDAEWTFSGGSITDVAGNVNLGVTQKETADDISGLIPEGTGTQIFEFSHSGVLPAGTSFMTELPAGKFGEISYLYHYNAGENQLEYVGELSTAYNRVTMSLTHCSSYVLTNVKLPASDNVIYPSEHQHVYKVVNEKLATCTEAGYEERVCEICGDSDIIEIAALGHHFEWVIDKEATATEAGLKHEECTVCAYAKDKVEIPATGEKEESSESSRPAESSQTADSSTLSESSSEISKGTDSSNGESQNDNTNSPRTGDNSNIVLWSTVMLAAGAALTAVILYSRKKEYSK